MCKRVYFLGLLIALPGAPLAPAHAADKPEDQPVFSGPAAPEELQVLAPLIGQWQAEATIKPSLRVKEGFTSKGESSAQWIHNGHFLRAEGYGISQHGRFEWTVIITYDRGTKQFRQFGFNSLGIVGEAVGEWDDQTRTMTWKGVHMPAGWTALSKVTIEKDQLVQTMLVKNERDEIVNDVTSTAKRKNAR
jgi:hypothetical protein